MGLYTGTEPHWALEWKGDVHVIVLERLITPTMELTLLLCPAWAPNRSAGVWKRSEGSLQGDKQVGSRAWEKKKLGLFIRGRQAGRISCNLQVSEKFLGSAG